MHQSKITVYRNGQPCQYREVSFYFSNGHTNKFATDQNGVAYVRHASDGKAIIYVDGQEKGSFRAPGSDVIHL